MKLDLIMATDNITGVAQEAWDVYVLQTHEVKINDRTHGSLTIYVSFLR